MKNLPAEVQYKITTPFGFEKEGSIRKATLVLSDGDFGLVLHDTENWDDTCPAIEIVKREAEYWVFVSEEAYLNVDNQDDWETLTRILTKWARGA